MGNESLPSCHNSWLVTSTSSPFSSISILLAFTCILEIVSTLLNLGVFLGLLRLRKSNSNRYLAVLLNLVVTDLLYNLTAEFLYIVHLALQTYGTVSCQIVVTIGWLGLYLCLLSFFMLVLATFERYIAIFHPFRYLRLITSRIFLAAISFVYLVSIIFTCMFRLSNFSFAAGISVLVLLSFGGLLLACVYIRIFWLRRKIGSEIQKQKPNRIVPQSVTHQSENEMAPRQKQRTSLSVISSKVSASPNQTENTKKGESKARQRDRKNVFLVVFLLICMAVCYLPYLIGVSLYVFAKNKVTISKELLHWLWSILLINATINPVLFFYIDKEIRYHICRVFNCLQFAPDTELSTGYSRRISSIRPMDTNE